MTVRWQQVWSLFEEAIALPVARQAAFLDQACADDLPLRAAVENLLEADRRSNPLLDQPIAGRSPLTTPTEASPGIGARGVLDPDLPAETIGPYRLLRTIGQGGMSTVYLAVRDDDTFERQVVVKLIRRGLESEAMIHRLQVERQILAGLTHPHIARLYDGGATVEGLPYFVMEYVEGQTLDAHCATHRLSIDQRLGLFSKVCDAVRYAHQNLVVHRDLKPANIMVDGDGEPRLLDFGIAKLLNPETVAGAAEPTVTRHGALTPNYASPEQIRGRPITTASDVYSLGVVLYRLLTGQLPFDLQGLSPTEIERRLTETEPAKPSAALAQTATGDRATLGLRARRRQLEGDLDAIVLKALRSTPGERYASVEQFAADLDHYRTGRPVTARRGTWRYRANKFVRRHRLSVGASVVAALVLAALGATIVWQSIQVRQERDEVQRENVKKTQVQALLLELIQLSNPYVVPGTELTVRQALDRSATRLTDRLHDQPDVRAELLHTTGSIRVVLGDTDVAAQELEEALALRQEREGAQHRDTIETATVLAEAYLGQGKLEEAEALARATVATARDAARTSGDDAVLIPPLTGLVVILCYRSHLEAAVAPAFEAWELVRDRPDAHPYDITLRELLGMIHSNRGEYDASITRYREAVSLRNARQGADHPEQMNALNNLALSMRRSGRFDDAEATYKRVLDLYTASFGDRPSDKTTRTKINLAGALLGRGDFAQAEVLYRQTLNDSGEDPDGFLGIILRMGIAQTVLEQGRAREAERLLRTLVPVASEQLGAENWRVAQANILLGASLSAQERFAEAEPLLVDSYRHMIDGGAQARRVDDALDQLRRHLERMGRADEVARYEGLRDESLRDAA